MVVIFLDGLLNVVRLCRYSVRRLYKFVISSNYYQSKSSTSQFKKSEKKTKQTLIKEAIAACTLLTTVFEQYNGVRTSDLSCAHSEINHMWDEEIAKDLSSLVDDEIYFMLRHCDVIDVGVVNMDDSSSSVISTSSDPKVANDSNEVMTDLCVASFVELFAAIAKVEKTSFSNRIVKVSVH